MTKSIFKLFSICTLVLGLSFQSLAESVESEQKISKETSLKYLLKNITPADTARGVVVASPSRAYPNYFFHWVRDAALVMSTVFDLAMVEKDQVMKDRLIKLMYDFVYRAKQNQMASGFLNLGEPKYNVDGTPFTGPWGRPQHDGPGLRAVTLIKFANYLLDNGKENYVRTHLYTPTLPALSVIKQDLEYVAKYWNEQGFDYWEEVMGLHFATAMGHRKALITGAKLAKRLGDHHAANYYLKVAKDVEKLIEKFWSNDQGYIRSTLFQTRGVWKSQLDISVILGVLHADTNDNYYSVNHPQVLKTVTKLENTFKSLYKINSIQTSANGIPLATAIGRYPEDTYNGYDTNGYGHAWFLATFAMAEFHLKLKKKLTKSFEITETKFYCDLIALENCQDLKTNPGIYKTQIINTLDKKAHNFFNRANFHAGDNGHMSEQMNRFSGYMEGAKDLTWSYASHLSALLQL